MTLGDALVDPRLWIFLLVFGTPILAIQIIVFKGAEHIISWIERKLGVPQ